jgi:hypothetical protein
MPSLVWTQSIAAGAVFRPLDGWQYEYVPAGGAITIYHRATAVGLRVTITSGSDTLQERSPVPAGGTAGVTPGEFQVPPISDEVAAGDRIKINYENPTGGAVTVDGIIDYTPAG